MLGSVMEEEEKEEKHGGGKNERSTRAKHRRITWEKGILCDRLYSHAAIAARGLESAQSHVERVRKSDLGEEQRSNEIWVARCILGNSS